MASFRVLPGPLVGVGHEGTLGAILIADHACPLHPMWMRLEPSKRQPTFMALNCWNATFCRHAPM